MGPECDASHSYNIALRRQRETPRGKMATRGGRRQLAWCSDKPGDAEDRQRPPEAGKSQEGTLAQDQLRGYGTAETLILDFCLSELWRGTTVLSHKVGIEYD